jgi:hypothetical protein
VRCLFRLVADTTAPRVPTRPATRAPARPATLPCLALLAELARPPGKFRDPAALRPPILGTCVLPSAASERTAGNKT